MKNLKRLIMLAGLTAVFFSCVSYQSYNPPLYDAASDGELKKVQQLVESGEDIDAGSYRDTPLEAAAYRGHLEVVQYLLSQGAQAPQKAYGNAVYAGHMDVAKCIDETGLIDVNMSARSFSKILKKEELPFEERMQTVMDLTNGKMSSPYLLNFVAPEHYQEVIDFFNLELAGKLDGLGNSLLHIAAMWNNYDLVMFLLEKDFDINFVNDKKHTALFYAVTVFGPNIDWNNPVIEDETTAHINFISDMPYYSDPRSVQQKQVNIVLALLDAGINVNQQNYAGWTVLHFACAGYPEGLQELLLSKGTDPDLTSNLGRTAADILVLR